MLRAIIYLRVSTEEQAEKGFSLYAQREECIKKAKDLNCTNLIEFVDEGVSGSILERPMLMNAVETLKSDSYDFFICYDSSRLSRNVSHQLILLDTIKKYGAKLIFVRSSYEDTAEGRFQLTIMAAVDEYERAKMKVRMELGKRAKAKQKQLTHNPGLYGYDFDKVNDTLQINETQAQIVKIMFKWLLEDLIGPTEIAKKLNQMQILSMRGKLWSRVSINRILKNFSYTGTLYIRRYDTKEYRLNKYKKKGDKVKAVEKPREQWISISIPPIIDIESWEKAKLQLDKAKRSFKKGQKEQYLLSGLLRCGICGGTLFGRSTYKNGQLQSKYYCCINKYNYSKNMSDRCLSGLYKADALDKAVWNKAKSWILKKGELEKLIESRERVLENSKNNDTLKNILLSKEEEKERVLNLYQLNIINEEELKKRIHNISEAVEALYKEFEQPPPATDEHNKPQATELLYMLDSYLENMDTASKNKLLHIIIKEIIIKENSLNIKALVPSHIINDNLE